jgi:hypothetical protein
LKIHIHEFQTVKMDGYQWAASCRGRLILGTERKRGWVGPTAGVDAAEKRNISCSCRESNHPYSESASQSLLLRTSVSGSQVTEDEHCRQNAQPKTTLHSQFHMRIHPQRIDITLPPALKFPSALVPNCRAVNPSHTSQPSTHRISPISHEERLFYHNFN